MAQLIADRRDVDFVLHEQMEAGELAKNEKFAEFDKKTIDLIVSEARNLSIKEILPTQEPGDEGCRFEDGKVMVPESFHKINKLFNELAKVLRKEGVEQIQVWSVCRAANKN